MTTPAPRSISTTNSVKHHIPIHQNIKSNLAKPSFFNDNTDSRFRYKAGSLYYVVFCAKVKSVVSFLLLPHEI